ncbi:MAG: hypothetical protein IRZ16_14290 [Myxococcaceae bacterium]|nr:hypothetical protein [Myxococcaceae bacterium]
MTVHATATQTKKTSAVAPASTAMNPVAGGLTEAQRAAHEKKLIATANLAAEQARQRKLKKEAAAEKMPKLVAAANQRLQLIAAEQKTRMSLAGTKLADGTTAAQFALRAQSFTAADLDGKVRSLTARLRRTTLPKDAKTKLTVLLRERDRREVNAQTQAAAREKDRLEAVKASYEKALANKTPRSCAPSRSPSTSDCRWRRTRWPRRRSRVTGR